MNTRDKLIAYFERRWGHLSIGPAQDWALTDGGRWIGHKPDVAKFSYMLHVVHPLSEDGISSLEEQYIGQLPDKFRTRIHSHLPSDLKEFYRSANGFAAFVGHFSLLGNARTGRGHGPHDIIGINIDTAIRNHVEERTDEIGNLVISRYDDESLVYISETGTCKAFMDDGHFVKTWPNLEDWILSEVERIGQYYDDDGKSEYGRFDNIPSLES